MLPVGRDTIEALAYINEFCGLNGLPGDLHKNPVLLKKFLIDIVVRQAMFGVQVVADPRAHCRSVPQFSNCPYTPGHQEFSNAPYIGLDRSR